MDLFEWLDSVQQSMQLVRQPGGRWVARVYSFRRLGVDPGYGSGDTPEAAITEFLIRSAGEQLFDGDSAMNITVPVDITYRARWSI